MITNTQKIPVSYYGTPPCVPTATSAFRPQPSPCHRPGHSLTLLAVTTAPAIRPLISTALAPQPSPPPWSIVLCRHPLRPLGPQLARISDASEPDREDNPLLVSSLATLIYCHLLTLHLNSTHASPAASKSHRTLTAIHPGNSLASTMVPRSDWMVVLSILRSLWPVWLLTPNRSLSSCQLPFISHHLLRTLSLAGASRPCTPFLSLSTHCPSPVARRFPLVAHRLQPIAHRPLLSWTITCMYFLL
jgi:hypothetical protein